MNSLHNVNSNKQIFYRTLNFIPSIKLICTDQDISYHRGPLTISFTSQIFRRLLRTCLEDHLYWWAGKGSIWMTCNVGAQQDVCQWKMTRKGCHNSGSPKKTPLPRNVILQRDRTWLFSRRIWSDFTFYLSKAFVHWWLSTWCDKSMPLSPSRLANPIRHNLSLNPRISCTRRFLSINLQQWLSTMY